LDVVRITIWEGAREARDLFSDAHLELGHQAMEAGRPAEALVEFDRALEYPENLATGRLESTSEAHVHFLRGQALMALGRKEAALEAWRQAVAQPMANDPRKDGAREKAQEALEEAQGSAP
jgi:tetratricopeptide (TPR) repeat protein